MGHQVLLPKIGLTMEEGTIDEWLAEPGSLVKVGQPLLRMATDKVDVEVEAEAEGLLHTVAEAGATLRPGALIAWLLADGEQVPAGASVAPAAAADGAGAPAAPPQVAASVAPVATPTGRLLASPNARRVATLLGLDLTTVRGTGPDGRIVSEDVEEAFESQVGSPAAGVTETGSGSRVTSPLVRRLARALGVDPSGVRGTGVDGTVTRADVHRAAQGRPAAQAAAEIEARTVRVIPMTGMRAAIARNMALSLQTMAQLTHGYEADVTELVRLRAAMKEQLGAGAGRIPTVTDFIARAAVLAMREHPELNASVRDDGIHVLEQVHLGVAVAVANGLMVPVVRNADQLPLLDLGGEIARLAAATRDGRIMPDDLAGGTFAITSLGTYGVDFFTPVINPGNVAILGVGRIRDGFRWVDERPVRTDVLTLSLTFDHRAVDGAPAAEFLRSVCHWLARPLALLAE